MSNGNMPKQPEYARNWLLSLCVERKAELFDEMLEAIWDGFKDRKDPLKPRKSLEDVASEHGDADFLYMEAAKDAVWAFRKGDDTALEKLSTIKPPETVNSQFLEEIARFLEASKTDPEGLRQYLLSADMLGL